MLVDAAPEGAVGTPPATKEDGRWSRWRSRRRAARDDRRKARAERRAPEPEPRGELSGLALLLDQLDALLRDPTLANALRRFTGKLADGMRGFARALKLPRLRKPAWLRLPHLPRWLLWPLLALLLALVALSLLSRDDKDRSAGTPPSSSEIALPGAGMPPLQAAPDDPPPARIALVVDDTYSPAALRRELRSLGQWLDANHAPGTRLTLIDAASGRATAPLSAAQLSRATPAGAPSSTSDAIAAAFRGSGGRRLLVGVGDAAPRSAATTLTVATRPGGGTGANVPVRRGGRARVTIDDRRPNALAASVARALIAISGQREQR